LVTIEECDALISVMAETWGPYQLLPREVVRALGESGNMPWGAFEGSTLVGYVLGWAGVDAAGLHLHSHMLAVLPGRRHGGVGFALKLAQRAQALEQGITVVRWTFDPLVARNAYFNLQKLGAVVDRFERDFYGEMTDELNRGERSDRFVVRWDLEREPGARDRDDGEPAVLLRRSSDGRPEVVDATAPAGLVEVPAEKIDPELSVVWRDAVADVAERLLADGVHAIAFERERSAYLFAPESRLAEAAP